MDFFNKFDMLAKQKGTTVNAIAKRLGLSSGSITAWKNGTEPRASAITEIAAHLNVTTDYLLGRTDNPAPLTDGSNTYDEEAQELLRVMYERPDLKPLLKTTSRVKPEDVELADKLLKRLAGTDDAETPTKKEAPQEEGLWFAARGGRKPTPGIVDVKALREEMKTYTTPDDIDERL